MKKNLFYSTLILLSVCAFAGCNDDKEAIEVLAPAVLQGKVYTMNADEVGQPWQGNQMIGVTMLKANSTALIVPYHNIKYKATVYPIGYFSPVATDDVLYYPEDGSKVDIISYYPYRDNLKDDLYPMNIVDQTIAANFNFIYANNSKGLSKDNKKTTMELRPVLSKLIVNLVSGDGVTDSYLAGATISVINMNTKAGFNLLTGSFEASSMANKQDIVLPALAVEEGIGGFGMLFPITSTQGCRVKVVLPKMNRTYYWDFDEFAQLESGHRYSCDLRVGLDKIEVITTADSPIENWVDGETVTGDASAYAPELIKNSIASLPATTWTASGDDALNAPVDTWFLHLNSGTHMDASVAWDVEANNNILYGNFISGTSSWFRQYVAYRMQNIEPTVYTLKFKAKGSGAFKCYIKTNDTETFSGTSVFIANNLVTGAKPYNGYVQVALSNDGQYKEYSLDFNCAKIVKDPYGHASCADATPKSLANFFIAFSPNAVGCEFYIDQVSFKRKLTN